MTEEDLTELLAEKEIGVEGARWISSILAGFSPATAADIVRGLGEAEADPRGASRFIRKILDQLPEKGFITKDGLT